MSALIINLFAGPCSYKSTIGAEVFAKLKWSEVHAELSLEFAKQKIYEENAQALRNQFSLGFNQLYNQKIIASHVDVVVCDSPFILSNVYNSEAIHLNSGFIEEFKTFKNINYFLERGAEGYTTKGRIHTYDEAVEIDNKIKKLLDENNIDYKIIPANREAANIIYNDIIKTLERSRLWNIGESGNEIQ